MREQQMVDGDWMRINKVTCVQDVEGGPVLYIQSWLLGSGGWSMARVLVLLPSITFQNTTPAINQELNLITWQVNYENWTDLMMMISLESIVIGYLTKYLIILESKIHGKLLIFESNGGFFSVSSTWCWLLLTYRLNALTILTKSNQLLKSKVWN